MSNRHPPRGPPSAQGNRGWEKRIPLTYGEPYQHLSWMPEYEEFCRSVEKSRRDAADRKYETLVQRSARSVAQNLCRISPEAIASLPDHVLGLVVDEVMANPKILTTLKDDIWDAFPLLVLPEIWDRLYRSQQLNLHLWKALSSRLRAVGSEHGKDLRLYRFERVITSLEDNVNWDFKIYTQPLISPTFDFIASLSIGAVLPMMDYIRLSSIVNLGTLEISDRLGYLPKAEKEPPRIDLDRLFRAWASRAEGGTAFQVLRSLRVYFKETSLTTNILPHLNKFPALGIVYPGTIKWSYEKGKMTNRGKYLSDYDFDSIRPLLPQGWKGVTIRGPANGMMRDIHNGMKYPAAVDNWKELSKDDYDLHPSYAKPTAARGLNAAEWRLHAQYVLEGKPTRVKMDNNPAKREFVEEVYERDYGWPMPKPLGNDSKARGEQIRKRVAFHRGDMNYDMSTERVRGMDFGILGGIRLDKDLEAVGMDAGLAMLCVAGDGEWMLKVESKVPIVTLRIGESVNWRKEGETVLLREDLPFEEEKGRAKNSREEGKEERRAWFRPPKREKTENKEKVGEKLMDRRESIRLHKAKKAKEKAEKEAKGFDKSFWKMVGLSPPQAEQG